MQILHNVQMRNSAMALQGVAKRLAGQQLARLLTDAGLPVTVAAARSAEAAPLRKDAAQAALVQEMSIYRKGAGKQARLLVTGHCHICMGNVISQIC
jgi:hypothetical protein